MNVNDKQILKAQVQTALATLSSAKAMAQAPIVTPSGPAMIPALSILCTGIDQLAKALEQTIDKL